MTCRNTGDILLVICVFSVYDSVVLQPRQFFHFLVMCSASQACLLQASQSSQSARGEFDHICDWPKHTSPDQRFRIGD